MAAPPVNRYVAGRPVVLGLAKILLLAISRLPVISAAPTSLHPFGENELEPRPSSDPSLWLYLSIAAALVLSGGAFAGLTIALMGQDEVYLQVIKTSGEGVERKNAASVLHLLSKGKHWVLVTLLLSNVITNETLPIVLDRSLGGGWPAVLGSTVLIVIFGEIVPQSICVRYGLPIGAWMAPSVLALMYIMSPVAWPVAKLLDKLLGEDHGTIYKKAGLKTLVTLHKTLGEAGEQLNSDEVTIISAVLDLKEKSVGSIMTPMDDVFTMSADTVLDEPTMDLILSAGYSRIPIHAPDNPRNFLGMLLVKMLITYDPEDCRRVREFALATLPETRPETSCLDIVNFFQEGKAHMVLVSDYPGEDRGALGVVTLEDVIEELIGEEIIDESDVFIDVHKAIRRMTPAPKARVPKGRVVEEPPAVHFEGEHPEPQSEATERTSGELRRSSIETPLPRFQMRIPNYQKDPDSPDRWVTHIGATDEIREHLKHLGPSNLASRPRQTRYQNVKIKRGRDSPTPSGPSDTSASVTAPLLQSADVDGIASTDYGAVSASKATTASSPKPKHIPQIAIPEAVDEEDDSYQQPQPSHGRTASRFIESSCAKPTSRPLYIHDGPARSGSITEHVVDINGVRKMVLHTTSTSSSETDRPSSRPSTDHSHGHKDGSIAGSEADTPKDPNSILRLQKKRRKRRKRTANSTSNSGKDEERPLLEH